MMMNEKSKRAWFTTPTAHWSIVVVVTLAGALWLRLSGAEFVRGNPVFYFLTPFLFLGMLVAELVGSATSDGWTRPTSSLATVISFLVALFVASQFFVMPLSTDLPMLTFLILHRRFISPRTAQWRTPEMWAGILMLALVMFIKITFLPQLAKIITGAVVGLLLFAFDLFRQINQKQEGSAQPNIGQVSSEAAPSASPDEPSM